MGECEKKVIMSLRYKEKLLEGIQVIKQCICQEMRILEKHMYGCAKDTSKYISDLACQKYFLELEERNIIKIWTKYYNLDPIFYEVLKKIYVENKTWRRVEVEMHVSHSTLVRIRKKAIQELVL